MLSVYFIIMLTILIIMDVVCSIINLGIYHDIARKKRSMKENNCYDYSINCLEKLYKDLPRPKKEAEKDVLLVEYHRTQDMLRHYDNLNWEIGSILVGSNLVALGFISNTSNPNLLFAAAFGGSISLFAFSLWFFRHVSIYNVKNDRLYIIEYELGMAQHRMIDYANRKGWLTRTSGKDIVLLLYFGFLFAWLIVIFSVIVT